MAYVVYDDIAVWGMGATEDEARDDSRRWLLDAARKDSEPSGKSSERDVNEALDEIVGRLGVGIATDALFQAISDGGGNCAFTVLKDGRIGTFDELDEEAA